MVLELQRAQRMRDALDGIGREAELQAIMITVTYCNILVNFWPIVYHLCELLAQSIEYRFQGDFPMIERRFEKFTVNGPKVH